MSSVNKHIAGARERLMEPDHASCGHGIVGNYVVRTIDQLVTELNQSGEPHFLAEASINVDPNVGAYNLDNRAPNYGKGRYLYTVNESDPYHNRGYVELVSPEDLVRFHEGGDSAALVTTSMNDPHTAVAASIYYSVSSPGPGNLIEFGPIPQLAAEYKLVYEPSVVRPSSREEGFRLDQFDNYVEALTARRCLPHAQWKGLSPEMQMARKVEIREALDYDIGSVGERRGYAYLFWMYRQSSTGKDKPTVVPFGYGRW